MVSGLASKLGFGLGLNRALIQGGGVVPINPGTPDGPEEAVISPAVTMQRSTYSLTKQGTIISRPAQMSTGNGCYYEDEIKVPSAAMPDRRFIYYSSDHAADQGGIYLDVSNGDPSILANRKTYGDAVAAGWLDDIPSKPAANPIWTGPSANTTPNNQCETPSVVMYGGKFVMLYQLESGVPGARNQTTLKAVSLDGVNWTGENVPFLQVPILEAIGDGHSGYGRIGKNPYPRNIIPEDYIIYSLAGGQSRPTFGLWAVNDPYSEASARWVSAVNKPNGRFSPANAISVTSNWLAGNFNEIDVKGIRKVRQGYSVPMNFSVIGAGATARSGMAFEALFAEDGITMIGKPQPIVPNGPETYDAGEVATPVISTFGDKRIAYYVGATADNAKTVCAATGPLRNPQNTWFRSPSPATPPDFTETVYDLRNGLPAGVEIVTAGGATVTFDAQGAIFTTPVGGEAYLFVSAPLTPNDEELIEVLADDIQTVSGTAYRVPYLGFASSKSVRSAMTDALFMSNGEGTAATLGFNMLAAGVQPQAAITSQYYYGIGYGASVNNGQAGSKKHLGIRMFPQVNRAYAIGEGGAEMEWLRNSSSNMMTGFDKSKPYYPFFGVRGISNATTVERVTRIKVRRRTGVKQSGDATLGARAIAQDAANSASYTFAGLDIGSAAANRFVAFFVSGRTLGTVSDVTATFTPSGGSAIPVPQQHLHRSTYDSGTTFMALFVVAVPDGVSGSLSVAINASVTPIRCAVDTVAMYGIASAVPISVGSVSGAGNAVNMTSEINKSAGGIAALAVIHSTSSATFHTAAAEECRYASVSEEQTINVASNGTVLNLGVRNTGASTAVETTTGSSSSGAVAVVASWAKAA